MKKVIQHIGNFERTQNLIKLFQEKGTSISPQEFHKFIGSVDRNTLRMECNFTHLQSIMASMTEFLIKDRFIKSKPLLIAKTSSVYFFLNYYSTNWMDYAVKQIVQSLNRGQPLSLQMVLPVYKSCVQFEWKNNDSHLSKMRNTIISLLSHQLDKFNHQNLLRNSEAFHRTLRTVLLDPSLEFQELKLLIKKIGKIFNGKDDLKLDQNYYYVHSAKVYELLQIKNIRITSKEYEQFLKKTVLKFKNGFHSEDKHIENSTTDFELKGHSVFQIRFQRHLQLEGLWFERNKIIGLSQFDILIKGKLSTDYKPFLRLGSQLDMEEATIISKSQIEQFHKMDNLWKVNQNELWPEPILINLNGPYHMIRGDKSGIMRSESIKKEIAKYNGFNKFKIVDYKDWENKTDHFKGKQEFIANLIES